MALPESFAAFDQARAHGRVRAWGVSNFDAPQLAAALAAGNPEAIQNNYSLLARQDAQDLLGLCARNSVAYLAFSPLAGGWLTGKYRRGEPFPAGSRMTQRPGPYPEFVAGPTFCLLGPVRAVPPPPGTPLPGGTPPDPRRPSSAPPTAAAAPVSIRRMRACA